MELRTLRKKYASTTDPVLQDRYAARARMFSEGELKYARYMVSSFQRRGLGFISAPLLYESWKVIQYHKSNK
jgi:hypothetical protein